MKRYAKAHPDQAVLSLLEPPSVASSATSVAAARSMRKSSPHYRVMVLGFIAGKGTAGATSDEVQAGLKLSHQNGSARVSELARHGFIVDSGVKRPTRSGRKAVVYVIAGRQAKLPSPDPAPDEP